MPKRKPSITNLKSMRAEENKSNPNHFVSSIDALFGTEIQPEACPWFGNKAPLILGAKDAKASLKSVSTNSYSDATMSIGKPL